MDHTNSWELELHTSNPAMPTEHPFNASTEPDEEQQVDEAIEATMAGHQL